MHLSVSSTHVYFGLHWNTLLFSNCLSSCPCFDADNNVNNQTRQNSAIIFIRGARPNLWIILTFLKKSKNPSLNKQTSLQYCWLGGADIKGGGALGRRGGWQGGVGRGGVNSGRIGLKAAFFQFVIWWNAGVRKNGEGYITEANWFYIIWCPTSFPCKQPSSSLIWPTERETETERDRDRERENQILTEKWDSARVSGVYALISGVYVLVYCCVSVCWLFYQQSLFQGRD